MSTTESLSCLQQLGSDLLALQENALKSANGDEEVENEFIKSIRAIKESLLHLSNWLEEYLPIIVETYPDFATKISNSNDQTRQLITRLIYCARTFINQPDDQDAQAELHHFGRLTNHWIEIMSGILKDLPTDALIPPLRPKLTEDARTKRASSDISLVVIEEALPTVPSTPSTEYSVAEASDSSSELVDWREDMPVDVTRVTRSMSIAISVKGPDVDDVESWTKTLAATSLQLVNCAIANPSALIETAKMVSASLKQLSEVIEEVGSSAPEPSFKETLDNLLGEIRNCVIQLLSTAKLVTTDKTLANQLMQNMRDLTESISRLLHAKADPSSEEWLLATLHNVRRSIEHITSLPAAPSEAFIDDARLMVESLNGFFRAALAVGSRKKTSTSSAMMIESIEDTKKAMKDLIQVLRDATLPSKTDPSRRFMDLQICQATTESLQFKIQSVVDLFMIQKHVYLADVEIERIRDRVNSELEKELPKNFMYSDVVSKIRSVGLCIFTLAEHFLDAMKWCDLPEDLKLLQSFTDRFMNATYAAISGSIEVAWNDNVANATDDVCSGVSQLINFVKPVVFPVETNPANPQEPLSIIYSQIAAHVEQVGDSIIVVLGRIREAPISVQETVDVPEVTEIELPIYEEPSDYDGNIVFTTDDGKKQKQIMALNLNKLVEVLSSDRRQEQLIDVVILCYRSYITPDLLFRKILQRYRGPVPPEKDVATWKRQFLLPIQLRVCNFLKRWIETQYDDFTSVNGLANSLNDFVERTLVHDGLTSLAHQLKKSIAKQVCGGTRRDTDRAYSIDTETKLKMSFTPSRLIFSYEPMEIAEQLTLIDQKFFSRIRPCELLGTAWSQKNAATKAPHVVAMINRFNQLSAWVSSLILWTKDLKKRAKVMQRIIQIAECLRKLNNYNTLFAIFSGLNSPYVYRLKMTKQELQKQSVQSLDDLSKLFSSESAFVHYRSLLKLSTPPCLPYIGVFLSDLEFVNEGHKDYVFSGTPMKKLMNVNKMRLYANIMFEIQKYQSQKYNITSNPSLLSSLNLLSFANERALSLISVALEPRGDDS